MEHRHPQSTARVGGHPLHPMLIPFPLVFFISALFTDLVFVGGAGEGWATASRWLLVAGLAGAVLAGLTGLTDFLGDRRIRKIGHAWGHMIGNLAVVAIEAVNLLLRLGAGEADAVVPVGVTLSGAAVLILAYTGWAGGELVYRHGVAITGDKMNDQSLR